VLVFAGQSNAVGVDTLDQLRMDQLAPQPNLLFYGPNEDGNIWGPLAPSSNSPNLIDASAEWNKDQRRKSVSVKLPKIP
jgi:hypothetical protein